MVHDWLSHGENDLDAPPIETPVDGGDDFPNHPMKILRSTRAPTTPADDGRPAAYLNTETHWWDGSQIYGSSLKRQRQVRSDPETGALLPDGQAGLDARRPSADRTLARTSVRTRKGQVQGPGAGGRQWQLVAGPFGHAHPVRARA